MRYEEYVVLWIFSLRVPPDGGKRSDTERDGDYREEVAELMFTF